MISLHHRIDYLKQITSIFSRAKMNGQILTVSLKAICVVLDLTLYILRWHSFSLYSVLP